ncbi:MAG: glycosyltransferase [Oligoflexia bacterium]|nr:glycosyltransferase [Oligoflexia bacterium]
MKSNKYRILRIIARLNVGGPAKHCLWLLGLDKDDFETKLLYGQVESNEDQIPLGPSKQLAPLSRLRRTIGLGDLIVFLSILRHLFYYQPHIVHTHTSKAGVHGRLAAAIYNTTKHICFKPRAKVIHTFHGHTFHGYFPPWKERIFRNIERGLARIFSDKIVVISQKQFEEICGTYKIAAKSKFHIIPLGVDTDLFKEEILASYRGEFREEFNIPSNWKIVALVSRVAPIKNHAMFINVCEQYLKNHDEKIVFAIIGGGEQQAIKHLKTLVAQRGLQQHVLFTGNRTDLARIYADIDCMALTSLNEGTPLSFLEGMSAKIPCISTHVGGVPDILEDRGITIQNFNVQMYTNAVHTILYDKSIREDIIHNAYNYVISNHSIKALQNNVKNLYFDLLKAGET